jgi:exopolysaccharide biosynthesis polyprenyl glycosylphosphotransferase
MIQQQVYVINMVLMAVDAVCVIAAGYGAYYLKLYQAEYLWQMDGAVFTGSVMLVMFLNNYVMGKLGLYGEVRKASYWRLQRAILTAVFLDFAFLSAAVFLYRDLTYSRAFLLFFATLSLVLITFCRVVFQLYMNHLARNGFNTRRILVVGDMQRGRMVSKILDLQISYGHEIIGRLVLDQEDSCADDALGCIDDFDSVVRQQAVDEVVFALPGDRSLELGGYLELCSKMGIPVRILPALWDSRLSNFAMESCQGVPFLTLRTDNFNATGLMYKRILDVIGGLVGTLLFLIFYPFVAAAIKLDSPGPVLFRQKRMGRHGRVFHLYKFRSMYQDAESRKQELMGSNEMNGAIFKLAHDPRITRVGRFLRMTSLDEFPQFLSVLKGEMSLVGTRPPTLDEVEKYQPEHLKRIAAKPGITGLWQVSGRNKIIDFEKIVALDCQYLDHWRFSQDLKILAKTVFVVLQRKGAV